MATRLSVKKRKQRRDRARAYKEGKTPKKHKVAKTRSARDKGKKRFRSA